MLRENTTARIVDGLVSTGTRLSQPTAPAERCTSEIVRFP